MDLAMLCNDAYAEYSSRYPDRLKWFARIPLVHLDDALAELHRCFDELGAHGVILPTNIGGEKSLDDPEYRLFWEEAARFDLPIFLHPCNAACHSRWHKYSLLQKINWPADSTLALSRLVLSGIFDRHPELKLIGSHLGGMTLMYLDRLNWLEGNPECTGTPEEYFKKIYYDIAGPVRAAAIRFVCDTVGADHVLFGADYPHGRGGRDDQFLPMALKAMEELDIPPEDKEKIFYKNALRIFRFQ
jgi:aminocarboxymuconate-semialdehyde decarboxylase